ncbi:MAG: PHP domain-containing protein, partial [Bacteroidota bacterium]
GLPYIIPELREGMFEFEMAQKGLPDALLELKDLKGILHAHSTYSDGKQSLKEMAQACQSQGYEYLGITDHSKSAFYANGLYENRVEQQHKEIDQLNEALAPFRIFKGIESDILADGRLDYADEVLASFDFVIVSIHTALKMDVAKATQRIIKAIEHPSAHILGHPSGRLLLRRAGYELNYETIIDACVANQVSIEINANPWRLDLDWRWVKRAMDKGVLISVNPDAHHINGIQDVKYGVWMGRKAGLLPAQTLNTFNISEIAAFFKKEGRPG